MSTLAIDTETTGLNLLKGCRPYLILGYDEQDNPFHYRFQVDPLTRNVSIPNDFKSTLKRKIKKYKSVVFHNANFDIRAFMSIGIEPEYWFDNFEVYDTMIASFCYKSSNRHGLKENSILYVDTLDSDERELEQAVKKVRRNSFVESTWAIAREGHPYLVGSSKEIFRCDYWLPRAYAEHFRLDEDHPYWEIDCVYGMFDVKRTLGLHIMFDEMMDDKQKERYKVERTRILPLIQIPNRGLSVNQKKLKETRIYFAGIHNNTDNQLTKIAEPILAKHLGRPTKFKPKSPKQLGIILYDHYKFNTDKIKHGPNGPSTDKDTLKHLNEEHVFLPVKGRPKRRLPEKYRFVQLLQKSRKVGNTLQFLDSYDKFQDENGLLHTVLGQTRTGTGRLAGSDPPTMNVGKDKADGGLFSNEEQADFRLRDVFGPRKEYRWFCVDYSQFQVRIFAVVSESHSLIEDFANGFDAHDSVAKRIFLKDNISDLERRAAKCVNFGILYGAGPARIERLAGMPGLFDLFLSQFPNAKKYLNLQAKQAKRTGYVHTIAGTRLYVPRQRPYAASCYVIQGTEADIFKDAIVSCSAYLGELQRNDNRLDCGIVNPVYDELVFEFPRKLDRKSTDFILGNCMSRMEYEGTKFGIPTKVDAKMTETSWGEAKPYELLTIA